MEPQTDLNINRLIRMIRQLPQDKKLLIKQELEKETDQNNIFDRSAGLKKLLLSGPVITKEEEVNFLNIAKEFDQWTKSLFV